MKNSSLLINATIAFTIAAAIPTIASAAAYADSPLTSPCGYVDLDCRKNYALTCVDKTWTCVPEGKTPTSTCIAVCPDGHQYPTCDHLGRELFINTDPCENHEAYSSTSLSCKDPNPLTCQKGTVAACVSDQWKCAVPSSIPKPSGKVIITAVSPTKTMPGKQLVITGTGFKTRNNIVIFADSVFPNIGSTNGKTLNFRIPATTTRPCYITKEAPCKAPIHTYMNGTYAVSVKVGKDVSNVMTVSLSTLR